MDPMNHPTRRNPWQRPTTGELLLFAHRGAPMQQPENTIAGFKEAQARGADVLEMDVRTTADGELIVHHDTTIDRVSYKSGKISALAWPTVGGSCLKNPGGKGVSEAKIPRLQDVFEAFPQARMNVDLCAVADEDVPKIFDWLRECNRQPGHNLEILLTSASARTQRAISANNVDNEVMQGMGKYDVLAVIFASWLRLPKIKRLQGRACQIPAHLRVLRWQVPLVTAPLRRYLQKLDCPLHVWWDYNGMVDEVGQYAKCKAMGADGIITNNIAAMATCRWGRLGE